MKRNLIGILTMVALSIATIFVTSAVAGKRTKKSQAAQSTAQVVSPVTFVPGAPVVQPDTVETKRIGATPAQVKARIDAVQRIDSALTGTTRVSIHPRVQGGTDELHEAFAAALALHDPKPADRIKYFDWLQDYECQVSGWEASVLKMELAQDGWNVTVSVKPQLAPKGGGVGYTHDSRFEIYYFDGDRLNYIEASTPQNRIKAILVD